MAQVQLARTDQVFGPTVRVIDPAEPHMPTNLFEKDSGLGEQGLSKKNDAPAFVQLVGEKDVKRIIVLLRVFIQRPASTPSCFPASVVAVSTRSSAPLRFITRKRTGDGLSFRTESGSN